MALIRSRRLFLVRGDFRRTRWYLERRPPPLPAPVAGLSFAWREHADWQRQPGLVVAAAERARERFEAGGRCLGGTDAAGTTVYEIWVLPAGAWIDWIAARVEPPERYALYCGAWTHPDWRGRGVHTHGLSLACAEACRIGRAGVYAGIEEHEVVPHAARRADSGLYPLLPDAVLVLREALGFRRHRREAPPAAMVRDCEALIRAAERNFPGPAA